MTAIHLFFVVVIVIVCTNFCVNNIQFKTSKRHFLFFHFPFCPLPQNYLSSKMGFLVKKCTAIEKNVHQTANNLRQEAFFFYVLLD